MSASDAMQYTESGGNVFADLGVADPEEVLAKAELARQIALIIAERGITQTQAAEILGLDEPKLSALLQGKLAAFSIDRLLCFLLALDRDVEIIITQRARAGGHVRVVGQP